MTSELMVLLKPIYSWVMFVIIFVGSIVWVLVGIAIIGTCAEIEKWCRRNG